MRLTLAPAACAVVLLGSRAAAAQSLPPLTVTRDADASDCPDTEDLARRVARTIGKPLASSRTRFHVAISRDLEGYTAVVRAYGERAGERRFADVGPTCKSLADALVVSLAIVMDAERELTPLWMQPSGPPESVRAPGPATPTPEARASPSIDAGAGAHFGALEHPGMLVRVGASYDRERLLGGLELRYLLPQTARRSDLPGTARVQLLVAALRGCVDALGEPRAVVVRLCLAPMLGWLRGDGRGFETDLRQNHVWAGAGASMEVGGRLAGPVGWFLDGTGAVALSQRFFVVDGAEHRTLFASSPPAGFAEAGLRVVFR